MYGMKKGVLTAAVILSLGAGVAQAATFEMYDPNGTLFETEVDNTVVFTYDTNAMTFGVSSSDPFLFLSWTASGGVLYAPGTYTININGDGNDEVTGSPAAPLANGDGLYTFTVPAGSYGGNSNIAWAAATGIDVFMAWSADGTTSLDIDGDGIPGARIVDNVFMGLSANFTPGPAGPAAVVPVPAAVWLFGSGLLSLLGFGRIRDAQSKNRS
jgi:hypothetical protein